MAPVPSSNDLSQQILAQLMRARNVSSTELAEACNCSRGLVNQWLSGSRRITDGKIRRLAAFFGVSESYMKYGTPPLDADRVGEVAAGAIEALIDADVIKTHVSAEQIGNFIAQICTDYEVEGDINQDQIARYIRMIAPLRTGSHRKE